MDNLTALATAEARTMLFRTSDRSLVDLVTAALSLTVLAIGVDNKTVSVVMISLSIEPSWLRP